MEGETAHDSTLDLLRQAERALTAVATAGLDAFERLPAGELLTLAELAGSVQRLTEGVMVPLVHAVERQCRLADPDASLAARHGLRDHTTLLMTVTGASRHTLAKYRRLAAVTCPRGVGSTGLLPTAMPHLADALHAGAIGLDQALLIRDTLNPTRSRAHPDALDTAEQALVAAATGAPDPLDDGYEPGDGADRPDGAGECESNDGHRLPLTTDLLAIQARAWRDAIDPDGPEPAYEQQRQQRSFTLGQRPDGMWAGRLLLPADQGTALRLALDAHNAPRTHARHHTDPDSSGTDSGKGGSETGPVGSTDERSTAQRQADTLLGLVTSAIEQPHAPRIGGEAATLVVTITKAELDEHATTGGGIAHLEHTGDVIPAHVAARILCDGYLQACVLDHAGLPLQLGRARRTHTTHQRRAILTAYPGGCQNPDCTAPPGFTEIHHPVWWSNGGTTDTGNGIPLCPHCHTELHAGRLRCILDANGRWSIRPSFPLRPRRRRGVAAS